MYRTPTLTAVALLLTLALVPTGHSETDAGVTIVIEAPDKLLSDHEPFAWSHTLTWTEAEALNGTGPTALDLLDHAVAARDTTYTVTWSTFDGEASAYVHEVNGVESDFSLILVGHFWALYENDESADMGINHLALQPGDVIRLTYTGWPVDA